ncbi:MAG: hypothetical protein ACYCUL_08280 [Metallibacterium scheffleri]
MERRLALLMTAALLTVPPSLYAQATLTLRGGGTIVVLGPASAMQRQGLPNAVTGNAAAPGAMRKSGMAPAARTAARAGPTVAIPAGRGGCRIYGFTSGLSGSSTLRSIGAFDVTGGQPPSFNMGTSAPSAYANGGQLSADAGAINPGAVVGSVPRAGGTLFQYATSINCGQGTPFTATLTSNPAGTGSTVVATANALSMQATYSMQYQYDPNNPYLCAYSNNPFNYFLCNIWNAQVSFNFITSSFAATGATTYSLNIVQATIKSP